MIQHIAFNGHFLIRALVVAWALVGATIIGLAIWKGVLHNEQK